MKIRHYLIVFLLFILAACSTDAQNPVTDNKENTAGAEEESGSSETKEGGNLIIGTTAAPTLFNPFYSTDTTSMTIEGFLFSSVVTVDREFNPEGDLAKDWDVSEDGKTWTFYLHEDVKWHDGEDLTADDIVFTYNIPLNDEYDGPRSYTYKDIDSVKKIDDYTVEFQLSQSSAAF